MKSNTFVDPRKYAIRTLHLFPLLCSLKLSLVVDTDANKTLQEMHHAWFGEATGDMEQPAVVALPSTTRLQQPRAAKKPTTPSSKRDSKQKRVPYSGPKLIKRIPDGFYQELNGALKYTLLQGESRKSAIFPFSSVWHRLTHRIGWEALALYVDGLADATPPRVLQESQGGSRNTIILRLAPRPSKDPVTVEGFNSGDLAVVTFHQNLLFAIYARNSLCKLKKTSSLLCGLHFSTISILTHSSFYYFRFVLVAFSRAKAWGAYLQQVFEENDGTGKKKYAYGKLEITFKLLRDIQTVFTDVDGVAIIETDVLEAPSLSVLTNHALAINKVLIFRTDF